jgi:adenosylcobinamide-GDP ribazoletransferase
MMKALLLALQFLTAIPVCISGEVTPRRMARAMAWFSVVGLMLGAILALVDAGLRALFPPVVSAALLLAVWVALTGALHLDGFLDCCDGLLVTRPPPQRLAILRDVQVGVFAVVGAICLLLVKFAALLELPTGCRMAALLTIPALTRAAMVYAVRAYPDARQGTGLGQLFREELSWREVIVAAAVAILAAGLALGVIGLALALCVWLTTVVVAWWVQRRIPGLTGDVYGAINELAEVGALLCLLLAGRMQLWGGNWF